MAKPGVTHGTILHQVHTLQLASYIYTHSKRGFGMHLKVYLSLDSVAIYKGAFYTRSNFTLKVLAELCIGMYY